MQEPLSLSPLWSIPVAILGNVLAFVLIWCAVCWILSRLGPWSRLARRYAAGTRPISGERHGKLKGLIGKLSYKGVLILDRTSEGFFLSVNPLFKIGHPPLFIPWSEVSGKIHLRRFGIDLTRLEIGHPGMSSLSLPSVALAEQAAPADSNAPD